MNLENEDNNTEQKKLFFYCFEGVSNFIHLIASIVLSAISMLMIGLSVYKIWYGLAVEGDLSGILVLNSVSLIVISIAIFDVGKYLIEEEVIRTKELRSPSEARKTLTKFVVIIVIAISLESLVYVFTAGKQDMRLLVYPCLLLLTAGATMIGLGFFQHLSVKTEKKEAKDE